LFRARVSLTETRNPQRQAPKRPRLGRTDRLNEEQIVVEFSQLTREDLRACLAYAAEREWRSVSLPAV
jgi:hypothetical protein